jgi:hypothetical protein
VIHVPIRIQKHHFYHHGLLTVQSCFVPWERKRKTEPDSPLWALLQLCLEMTPVELSWVPSETSNVNFDHPQFQQLQAEKARKAYTEETQWPKHQHTDIAYRSPLRTPSDVRAGICTSIPPPLAVLISFCEWQLNLSAPLSLPHWSIRIHPLRIPLLER